MTYMDRRTALLAFAAAGVVAPLLVAPAMAQTAPADGADQSDYVMQTLALGSVAMRTSEAAMEKATHPLVQEFASLEVAEQKTIASILASTEAGKTPPEPAPEDQVKIDEMSAMEPGAAFDMAYVDAQIEGHQKLLAVQQSLSGETEATVEAITARLAEQAVTSHIAMLNHIREQLRQGDQSDNASSGDGQPAESTSAPAKDEASGNGTNDADPNAAAPASETTTPAN